MAETVFMKVAGAVSRLAWEGAGVLGELCSFVKAASYGPVWSRKASEQDPGGTFLNIKAHLGSPLLVCKKTILVP